MILRTSLLELKQAISNLRVQLINNKHHSALLDYASGTETDDDSINKAIDELKKKQTVEKEYKYTANIITLYGALEHFVESLIDDYVSNVNRLVPDSTKLPDSIKNNYVELCKSIIDKAEENGKFKDLKKIEVFKSAYYTLGENNSSLIPESFMSAGVGNYKYSTICDCFVKLGLNNIQDQLKDVEPLKSHFISKYGESYSSQGALILYNIIDDLVVRRNQLAHGSDGIEIIGDDDFEPYIKMIDLFAEALCNYLRSDLAKKQWENCTNQERKATEVYKDNVVVIETNNEQFSIGGWLVYSSGTQDPHYGYCSIINIQINDEDKESVECKELMEVG